MLVGSWIVTYHLLEIRPITRDPGQEERIGHVRQLPDLLLALLGVGDVARDVLHLVAARGIVLGLALARQRIDLRPLVAW